MGRLSQDALTAARVSSALVLLTKVSTLSLINMQAASAGGMGAAGGWLAVRVAAASKAVSMTTSRMSSTLSPVRVDAASADPLRAAP
jgi:hypothetical protein